MSDFYMAGRRTGGLSVSRGINPGMPGLHHRALRRPAAVAEMPRPWRQDTDLLALLLSAVGSREAPSFNQLALEGVHSN